MRLTLLLMGLLVFSNSCDKDDPMDNVPVLSTVEVTGITANTATSGGNITDDGGTTVTVRGVCWSTNENPTIDDNKTDNGTGVSVFTSSVADLEPSTAYYLRAYATNSTGTGYGGAMYFTTAEGDNASTFSDPRDGKVYQTVVIGSQEWMTENLAYAPASGTYWAYDDDDANVEIYGYLYDWQTALTVCPTGWHLPSDEEWTELTDYLGENAGGKLMTTGTIPAGTGLWHAPNSEATNETGFNALPGGLRSNEFGGIGYEGLWWSTTEYDTDNAWYRILSSYNYVYRFNTKKGSGFSVRCLRD